MDERVAIFIDGSNLYHGLRNNFRHHNLNFAEFATKLCGSRRLFRTYYYNVLQDLTQRPDGYREQQEFLDTLRKTPYLEVRLGSTKVAQDIPVEKGGPTSQVWIVLLVDLDDHALYLNKTNGCFAGFEVHRIRTKNAQTCTIHNTAFSVPARRVIASTSEFGHWAWAAPL